MRIIVGVSHPKHVYIFKNPIKELLNRGHDVKVIAVEKEITEYLLKKFDIPYILIGQNQPTLLKKLFVLPKWEYLTYRIVKDFNPDILVGRALPHLAHVSAILNKPFIIFEDTEVAKMIHKITLPFSNVVLTPNCYEGNFGRKHIRFEGYFELAYLHPTYFKSNSNVLNEIGLSKEDKIIILRSVSWNASHDIADRGFTNILDTVRYLERYGPVLITSEKKLPPELEKYKINIQPERMHHLLYFANLYIGESATMACESAVLGIPSILISTSRRGYTNELEDKYGLVYNFSNPKTMQKSALEKACELLENKNIKREWQEKRMKMLSEKIDVTKYMTDFIEGYPQSFYEQREKIRKEL